MKLRCSVWKKPWNCVLLLWLVLTDFVVVDLDWFSLICNSGSLTCSRWFRNSRSLTGSRWFRNSGSLTGSHWFHNSGSLTGSCWFRNSGSLTGSRWFCNSGWSWETERGTCFGCLSACSIFSLSRLIQKSLWSHIFGLWLRKTLKGNTQFIPVVTCLDPDCEIRFTYCCGDRLAMSNIHRLK